MSWTLARDFAWAAARIDRERLLHAATAARAAHADAKDWMKWADSLIARDQGANDQRKQHARQNKDPRIELKNS